MLVCIEVVALDDSVDGRLLSLGVFVGFLLFQHPFAVEAVRAAAVPLKIPFRSELTFFALVLDHAVLPPVRVNKGKRVVFATWLDQVGTVQSLFGAEVSEVATCSLIFLQAGAVSAPFLTLNHLRDHGDMLLLFLLQNQWLQQHLSLECARFLKLVCYFPRFLSLL